MEDPTFYGQWINFHDQSQIGPKPVTNADWFHTFIIHVNSNRIVMWETLPNNPDWDCFKTQILQEILRTWKSTSNGTLSVFGCHTFVPNSWMCKKQTSVSHSSTESEIISLDAGLRLDGIPALDLWDLIVLGNTTQNRIERRDPLLNKREICSPLHTFHKPKQSQRVINDLDNIDSIPLNVKSFHQEAVLYVFEDNEAAIKMVINGRSPTMRHVSRTHRVALDWLFDRIKLVSKIQIKYIWHQKPTRRHADQRKFHTWRMESSFVFV